MINLDVVDGLRTAVVNEWEAIEKLDASTHGEVESLWLTLESGVPEFCEVLSMPRLQVLYIANCDQRLARMFDQRTLGSLRSLVVAESTGCLVGFELLAKTAPLEKLKIRDQSLLDDEVIGIQHLHHLVSLGVTHVPITDEFLVGLKCCLTLRRLDIYGTLVDMKIDGLSQMQFKAVRSLDVSGTRVDTDSVSLILQLFPLLERLIAHDVSFTDRDLRRIAQWPHLKVLDTGTSKWDFDQHQDSFWDL